MYRYTKGVPFLSKTLNEGKGMDLGADGKLPV